MRTKYNHTEVRKLHRKGHHVGVKKADGSITILQNPVWFTHYQYVCNGIFSAEITDKPESKTKSSTDYLRECITVQEERGALYEVEEKSERSFDKVSEAFNAITGKDIKGSDICLMLQILKDVRLYSNIVKPHEDSMLDKVSYASLHVEAVNAEMVKEEDTE